MKAIVIGVFLSKFCKLGQNNVAENGEVIQSQSTVIDDRNTIFAVPRQQSFVIHPNDGWWESINLTKLVHPIQSID
jgi:hypothetical protein